MAGTLTDGVTVAPRQIDLGKVPDGPGAEFSLEDAGGHVRRLSEYHGRPVVLFFFCGCVWCHRCATDWGEYQRAGGLLKQRAITLIVFSDTASAARDFAAQTGLDPKQTVLLPDPTMRVAVAYRAPVCPRVFVLDPRGLVVYTNNHADDLPRRAPETLAASRALKAIQRPALLSR
jgi:peroxiredoxin